MSNRELLDVPESEAKDNHRYEELLVMRECEREDTITGVRQGASVSPLLCTTPQGNSNRKGYISAMCVYVYRLQSILNI